MNATITRQVTGAFYNIFNDISKKEQLPIKDIRLLLSFDEKGKEQYHIYFVNNGKRILHSSNAKISNYIKNPLNAIVYPELIAYLSKQRLPEICKEQGGTIKEFGIVFAPKCNEDGTMENNKLPIIALSKRIDGHFKDIKILDIETLF